MNDAQLATLAVMVSNATELTKPVVETGCDLISTLLKRPLEVAGNMLGDTLYARQTANRIRMFARTKELLGNSRVPPGVLPEGFLTPALDAAGNVADPEMRDVWARLMASAIESSMNAHPAFIVILSQLVPDQVRILGGGPLTVFDQGLNRIRALDALQRHYPNAVDKTDSQAEMLFLGMHLQSLGLGSFVNGSCLGYFTEGDSQLEFVPSHSDSIDGRPRAYGYRVQQNEFTKAFVTACTRPE
jgi:hypothetical protein